MEEDWPTKGKGWELLGWPWFLKFGRLGPKGRLP